MISFQVGYSVVNKLKTSYSSAALRGMVVALSLAAAACQCSKKPTSGAPDASVAKAPEDPALNAGLQGIWGTSPSDIWATGSKGVILHYDGKRWQSVPSGIDQNITAISGTGPDDIWAVSDHGITLHYDGKAWTTHDKGESTLLSVWAKSKTEVWVSGVDGEDGMLRQYDKSREKKPWELLGIPGSTSLWRTWVSGDDIWMVGSDIHAKGIVVRGNGKDFDLVKYEGGPLRAIFGKDGNDVWVGGYDGTLSHWDGTKWTPETPVPGAHWLGMWGLGSNDIWAYGSDGVIGHYDGKAWSRIDPGVKEIIWSAWGSAANNVWFVGGNGTRLHWNGSGFDH